MFRFITALVATCALIAISEAANCHMRELDLCMATIMMTASDGVPSNEEDLDRICEPVIEGFECTGNYSKSCFTPVMQELYDMAIAEPEQSQRRLCTPGTEERTQFLKHAPCLSSAMSNEKMRPHLEDLLASMEKATEVHFQERIPIMCCGIQRMFSTALEMVKKECGNNVIQEGGAVVGLSLSGMSDMFCSGYEMGSEKCEGILPATGSPYKGVDSSNQLIRFIASAISNL